MKINPQIFRAYDIRGIVGEDLNGQLALHVGQAFGTWLKKNQNLGKTTVVVGRDNRFSSDELSARFVGGLLSTGCDVWDVGLAVTPLIHFASIKYPVEAAVMITASHNPKEFNGFRFDLKGCLPFYNSQIQELKSLIETEDYAQGIGQVTYKDDLFNDYKMDLKSKLQFDGKLKIVLDCANGAASKFAVELFEGLGLEVLPLFCNLDGDFPYHQPDPEERVNLQTLRLRVVEEKADLGFGFDTDADRFGVVDEKGTPYENDKILILLARQILKKHPGTPVLYDIKCSYVLPQEVRKLGGDPQIMKTGHPYYRLYMLNHPEVFLGGELSSHTFIKDNYYGYDDGFYAALRVIQIVGESQQPLSQHFANVPHTAHTEEIKINCPDEEKLRVVNEVGSYFFKQGSSLSDVDGYRVSFSTTNWFLIRSSNTSPYISLRFEAESKDQLDKTVAVVKEKLASYPFLDLMALGPVLREKTHNV